MKITYLLFFDLKTTHYTGVKKKVLYQVDVFKQVCTNVEILSLSKKTGLFGKLLHRIPFGRPYGSWEEIPAIFSANVLYIRKPTINEEFVRSLRKLKTVNPNIVILLEFSTFPYDKEMSKRLTSIPILLREKISRKKLFKYVDRAITYSKDDEIFRIPTIKIVNGVAFNEIKKSLSVVNTNIISIVIVASFAEWHGYDRLLKSFKRYVESGGKREVIINFVGNGEIISQYKKIIKNNSCLEKKVIFHGLLVDNELDQVYDQATVAIEVLGLHRKDISVSSSLKSREYLAKGLPIISANLIDIIPEDWDYFLKLPSNDEVFDFTKIIDFHDKIYISKESYRNVRNKIRKFGEESADIRVTMEPILNYIANQKIQDE